MMTHLGCCGSGRMQNPLVITLDWTARPRWMLVPTPLPIRTARSPDLMGTMTPTTPMSVTGADRDAFFFSSARSSQL